MMTHPSFDVIIVGGGLAGILCAQRLAWSNASQRIAVLEKEAEFGGKYRHRSPISKRSNGATPVYEPLYRLVDDTMKLDPDGLDLAALTATGCEELGIVSTDRIKSISLQELPTETGAKAITGLSKFPQWQVMEQLFNLDNIKPSATLNSLYSSQKKSSTGSYLEQLGAICGLIQVWQMTAHDFVERVQYATQSFHSGPWNRLVDYLLHGQGRHEHVTYLPDHEVVTALKGSEEWHLTTSHGCVSGKKLVVAQSPWEADGWLDTDLTPEPVNLLTTKTKPISRVSLTAPLVGGRNLPPICWLPVEECMLSIRPELEISLHFYLPYEQSLDAPNVTKAVRRLKRGLKRIKKISPDLQLGDEHLSLEPAAQCQPPAKPDRRWVFSPDQAMDPNQKQLWFCGDAYGNSMNGEGNIIASIAAVCQGLKEKTKHVTG